ncbi:uncharacterized protein LOC133333576 [Musca vetustissima]|uniref:uncharacterized protein LOC133333576 n=1 Tax=Musca vetustissima TaxID=27455 RepID=UPI002AB7D2AD|nr:uncharacterized protein LOC133333576 [Musca vetustissima]
MPVTKQQTAAAIGNKYPIVVDKWNISFDGRSDGLDVEDFIFRTEHLQRVYGCPWSEVIRDFQLLLKGDAKEWFWVLIANQDIYNWTDLKEALMQQYKSSRSQYEYLRDLEVRKQKVGESIDDYFHAMKKLRSKLRTPLPETDMIRIVKRNLRPDLSHIIYAMKIYTIDQLRDECKELEKNYLKKEKYSIPTVKIPQQTRRQYPVNEVYLDEQLGDQMDEELIIVEEVNQKRTAEKRESTLTCWNCQASGHTYFECPVPQRNLFCYRCGCPGVTCPTCPKCLGNGMKGVWKSGETRSVIAPDQ